MKRERVAVVNFTRMGDLIQSGPLLRSLKDRGTRELTLIVFSAFAGAARRLPMVDRVIALDVDRLVTELDSRRGHWGRAYAEADRLLRESGLDSVDVVYNIAHTRQSAMLCALMNSDVVYGMSRSAEGRIRVQGDWFHYLFSVMQDRTLNPFNLVEIYQRFAGTKSRSNHLEFFIERADREAAKALLKSKGIAESARYIVLQPGASSASRQWPLDQFAGVAKELRKRSVIPIITGSASDAVLAEKLVVESDCVAISVAGETEIGVLAAVLEGAEKVLSNDTGTIHLAAAVGTPTVGVFIGPASAKDTAPYGNGHVILEPDLDCAPCSYHEQCRSANCRRQINAQQVLCALLDNASLGDSDASLWNGVRVYRTKVENDGHFRLHWLNQPRTQTNPQLLEYYREFWETLFTRTPERQWAPLDQLLSPHSESLEGVDRLISILIRARTQVALLRKAIDDRLINHARVTEALVNQTAWQGELREFVERYPLLAPFPRYLLVRLSTVYGDNMDAYLDDIESILKMFERGMNLLRVCSRDRMTEAMDAVA